MKKKLFTQSGQTLVVLLIFMAIAVTLISASVVVMITSTGVSDKYTQGITAMEIAETGGENALLRLIRDPNYVGETLPVGLGIASINVVGVGSTARTITVTGKYNNFTRKLRITTGYNNGIVIVTPPWTEIYP